jgi:hypothetical protein
MSQKTEKIKNGNRKYSKKDAALTFKDRQEKETEAERES